MGLLASLFTFATVATTRRIHRTITSSLELQFENQDLVEDLKAAKSQAEALNERLEVRVRERTAELHQSTERLRAEITQREQIEEELLRARKLESLGVLAGGIAHDFNNFLTVVQGNNEMAKMGLDPGHPVQTILDQSTNACQRAAFLSSQLLTFAKGGAPVRRLVSVAKIVKDAVGLARAGAQTSIEVGIAEDLRFAEVDPNQIGQVLHNILLNARQAMPGGGIIEVHAANAIGEDAGKAKTLARISIRDYGCGISADVLPRIFDPYFTTKQSGSGLGLATAYAIVAKHGGNLSVTSKPGVGTVFTIDLLASADCPTPEAPVVSVLQTSVLQASVLQTGTERLLVMDDEKALRSLLVRMLTGLGYKVQAARDGAEAIALYESANAAGQSFDAILLDLTVTSGMGGIETAARLKELDPSLRLIVSSGYSDAPAMSDFRKYGFDAVIPKPWAAADLSKVFRKVLVRNPDRQVK
jgi:two-component system cell cycle sensor histidine kinase/response regulator CckA